MFQRLLFLVLTIVLTFILQINSVVFADSQGTLGEEIFTVNCACCHINGGNIIRRGKNLKMKTLRKYGYDTTDTIATIVTNGKNNMSAYSDRLNETQIQAVSQYVLDRAENNWK